MRGCRRFTICTRRAASEALKASAVPKASDLVLNNASKLHDQQSCSGAVVETFVESKYLLSVSSDQLGYAIVSKVELTRSHRLGEALEEWNHLNIVGSLIMPM